MNIVDAVQKVVADGHAHELYEIIAGISDICDDNAVDAVPIDNENRKYWQLTMEHLQFIASQGVTDATGGAIVEKNSEKYYAFPEEYKKWLELGCPGISMSEVQELLTRYSIS